MRRYRIVEQGLAPHFVTWTIVEWLPLFISDAYCRIITDSLEYCREHKGLLVHAYVIMPTHLHAIASAGPGADLSAILRDSRKHTSKQIVTQLQTDERRLFEWVLRDAARKSGRADGSHKVWTEGTHPETLESEKFFMQKFLYLHDNPVRKGLVEKAEDWRYSSAGFYVLGSEGPLGVDAVEW